MNYKIYNWVGWTLFELTFIKDIMIKVIFLIQINTVCFCEDIPYWFFLWTVSLLKEHQNCMAGTKVTAINQKKSVFFYTIDMFKVFFLSIYRSLRTALTPQCMSKRRVSKFWKSRNALSSRHSSGICVGKDTRTLPFIDRISFWAGAVKI